MNSYLAATVLPQVQTRSHQPQDGCKVPDCDVFCIEAVVGKGEAC
jgi:hypothetical protein